MMIMAVKKHPMTIAYLENALKQAQQKNPGLSWYKIAKDGRTSHPNLKSALDGTRGFSDEMLEAIAAYSELGLSIDELLAWRAMDEYPESALRIIKEIMERKENGV